MTSKKWLVSFIISALQWLLLSAGALALITVLIVGLLMYSCGGGDPT